jgi:hypothetical protein
MSRNLMLVLALASACGFASVAMAQVRLIGITGNLEAVDPPVNDETLYEINLTNAATTRLFTTTHIPDTDSIGYNPVDGRLYHISGSSTYRDNPGANGYRDNHYMESFDMEAANPANSVMAVYNGNPPSANVPGDAAVEFGLEAPFPDWLLPDHPRLDSENDPMIGDLVGPDEYDSARGMAWSAEENLFYLATGRGFYRMTPEGDSTFVAQPASEGGDMKGIAFVEAGGSTKLYAGSKETGSLYEIDPATGQEIGSPIQISAPISPGGPIDFTNRILGLTQHPETGVLYGLLEPPAAFSPTDNRQLVTIDLATGMATLIGELRTPGQDAAFASIAFVGFRTEPERQGDFNGDGAVNAADYVVWRKTDGSQAGYDEWRTNFGRTSGSGSALGSAAVPEPSALLLAAAAVLGLGWVRRR